jgi:hypothetical protein
VQEVFLERHFGHMNPAAARRPILRGGFCGMATGDAGNAKIGKTNGVPGGFMRRLLVANELADIERGGL